MSTWNYRLIRYLDGYGTMALHEVYYNEDGEPVARTDEACRFFADTPEEMVEVLKQAIRDVQRHPILDDLERWPGFGLLPGEEGEEDEEDDRYTITEAGRKALEGK